MAHVTVTLDPEEREGLVKLALAKLRSPRDQVRYILRRELERLGFLRPADHPTPHPQQESPHDPH